MPLTDLRHRATVALAVLSALGLSVLPERVAPYGPAVPPRPPLEFWRAPTAQIGMPNALYGTEITPEGALYTGTHEFFLQFGSESLPARFGSKRLLADSIPIVRSYQTADGLLWTIEAFETGLRRADNSPSVCVMSVLVANASAWPRKAFLSGAFRFRGRGVYRPKPKIPFQLDWEYRFDSRLALRDDRILGCMPLGEINRAPAPGHSDGAVVRGDLAGIAPDSPVLKSNYLIQLSPHEQRRLVFKIPQMPLPLEDAGTLNRLSYPAQRAHVVSRWNDLLGRAVRIEVPDAKLAGLVRSSITQMLIGLDPHGPWLVPRVNELQYDGFYLRDGAYIVRSLDRYGYRDEAERCLRFILSRQRPDGLFLSQPGQLDGWGEAMWAVGQHVRLTRNSKFAFEAYPAVKRAVAWLERARANDESALHLLPGADPHDNEQIGGHLFGTDFWAYRGLTEAVALARRLGQRDDAVRWSSEAADYRHAIVTAVDRARRRTGGFIPPALEPGGYDWGNLRASDPCGVLDRDDPRVIRTLQHVEQTSTQGIPTYSGRDLIHGYLGFDPMTTRMRRARPEDRRRALRFLLDEAGHSTGANGGFEYGSAARRDYGRNLSPHGCWAAMFLAFYRDALVRTEGREIVVGSALSPAWVEPGRSVQFTNVPTELGVVSGELRGSPGGAHVRLSVRSDPPGVQIRLCAPVGATGFTAIGAHARIERDSVVVSARTTSIELRWRLPADAEAWTARAALERWCRPPLLAR